MPSPESPGLGEPGGDHLHLRGWAGSCRTGRRADAVKGFSLPTRTRSAEVLSSHPHHRGDGFVWLSQ